MKKKNHNLKDRTKSNRADENENRRKQILPMRIGREGRFDT